MDPAAHVRVTNPIASDQALMRTALLPGICRNIAENAKHRDSFRLFEIGLEIHRRPAGLPEEAPHLVAAIYDRSGDGVAGLFEIKRAAECLMPDAEAQPATAAAYEHPARTAEIVWKDQCVGRIFELHPSLIETGRAAVMDLDLERVRSLCTAGTKYTPIRRYPSSAFDLSVIAGAREHAGKLQSTAASLAGPFLESIQLHSIHHPHHHCSTLELHWILCNDIQFRHPALCILHLCLLPDRPFLKLLPVKEPFVAKF
jgi:phenylalanyl-tRNA synthetase beta chain